MKFKAGDRVRKVKGYKFEGIIMSAYTLPDDEIRYDVRVDCTRALADLDEMARAYSFPQEITDRLGNYIGNCHGMIHIFAEEQLEIDPQYDDDTL